MPDHFSSSPQLWVINILKHRLTENSHFLPSWTPETNPEQVWSFFQFVMHTHTQEHRWSTGGATQHTQAVILTDRASHSTTRRGRAPWHYKAASVQTPGHITLSKLNDKARWLTLKAWTGIRWALRWSFQPCLWCHRGVARQSLSQTWSLVWGHSRLSGAALHRLIPLVFILSERSLSWTPGWPSVMKENR